MTIDETDLTVWQAKRQLSLCCEVSAIGEFEAHNTGTGNVKTKVRHTVESFPPAGGKVSNDREKTGRNLL